MLLSYMSLFFTASLCTNLYIPFRGALLPKVHYAVSLYGKQNFISNLRSKDGYIFSCYYTSLFAKVKKLLRRSGIFVPCNRYGLYGYDDNSK